MAEGVWRKSKVTNQISCFAFPCSTKDFIKKYLSGSYTKALHLDFKHKAQVTPTVWVLQMI